MRQLMLLRHAKSSWDDPATADRDRPLNGRGRRAVIVMRGAMRKLGLEPDLILVSSARRTLETLAALEPWEDTPLVETLDSLYLAGANQLLASLHGVAETVRGVLVIGHNPGLHDLALALINPGSPASQASASLHAGFPTAALAEFSIPGPWSSLGAGGGRLVRFLTPRALGEADS
jgi:phosphohistidine phosphatase